jgi:hypothetical protein
MTQTLYAHMNNKTIKNKKNKAGQKSSLLQTWQAWLQQYN